MSKDLTTSVVARSNVLNNRYALSKLEELDYRYARYAKRAIND